VNEDLLSVLIEADLEQAADLLRAGADVNARKQQGKSLLEDAIVTNLIGVVKRVDLAS
jgi:hypothetical protein